MKLNYIVSCLSIGLLLGTVSVHAQAVGRNYNQTSVNQSNNAYMAPINKIDKNGYIYNSSNIALGHINKDGDIINGNNNNIGRIYSNGYTYNGQNENVGRVNDKGDIFDENNHKVGDVNSKGQVFNAQNVVVGEVASKYKKASILLLSKYNLFTNQ